MNWWGLHYEHSFIESMKYKWRPDILKGVAFYVKARFYLDLTRCLQQEVQNGRENLTGLFLSMKSKYFSLYYLK